MRSINQTCNICRHDENINQIASKCNNCNEDNNRLTGFYQSSYTTTRKKKKINIANKIDTKRTANTQLVQTTITILKQLVVTVLSILLIAILNHHHNKQWISTVSSHRRVFIIIVYMFLFVCVFYATQTTGQGKQHISI